MANRHIAGSGSKAGQWVPCPSDNCRLGGTHISERVFYAVKAWLAETREAKKAADITKQDYLDFTAETAGNEDEWAVKAERLARKDKGFKDAPVPVFKGEKNLIPVVDKSSFKTQEPVEQTVVQQDMSYMELADSKAFMKTGNVNALRRLRHGFGLNDEQFNSLVLARLQMIEDSENMDKLEFYNDKSGEVYTLREIPEVREYIKTGSKDKLNDSVKGYYLPKKVVDVVLQLRKYEKERQWKRDLNKSFFKRMYKKT